MRNAQLVHFVHKFSCLFYFLQTLFLFLILLWRFSHLKTLPVESTAHFNRNPREICDCANKTVSFINNENGQKQISTCSDEASEFGGGQKVISFSLFTLNSTEKIHRRFLIGLQKNLELKPQFYSDWLIRVYSNVDLSVSPGRGQLCPLICSHADLFFCDVRNLPAIGNIDENPDVLRMTWRFLPLGDKTVWKFLSRDLDSRLSQRERDAVNQWEKSEFPFHGMRDNPNHVSDILGGMWGADNFKLGQETASQVQREILKGKTGLRNEEKFLKKRDWELDFTDQKLLTEIIYKRHRKLILTHDSFLCRMYNDTFPFPSKSNGYEFVGMPIYPDENGKTERPRKLKNPWPIECRPSYGKKWTFC